MDMQVRAKPRAAIYVRFSSEGQKDTSLEDQEKVCRQRAKAAGFEVVAVYADRAISGSRADRVEYQKALMAGIGGEFEILLAYDSSRLWRDQAEQWRAVNALKAAGVHVIAGDIDSRGEMGKVSLAVTGLMNELFLDKLSARIKLAGTEKFGRALKVKDGFDRTREEGGGRSAGTSYGYIPASQSKSRKVEIDPKTSKIVIEIFTRYAKGESPAAIAEVLNARGVPSPRGGKWLANTIVGVRKRGTGILNCELYIGQYVYGHTNRASREAPLLHVPPEQWQRAAWPQMAFVEPELWVKVRKMQEARSSSGSNNERTKARKPGAGPGRKPLHLLTGILVCGNCGSNFVANGTRDYVCPYVRTGACKPADGRKSVPPRRFRRDVVNQNMVALLKQELLSKDAIAKAQSDFRAAIEQHEKRRKEAKAVTELPAEIAELDARIAKLRARLKKGDPDLTADELQGAIERVVSKRNAAADALEAKQNAALDETMITLRNLPALMKDYERKIEDALKVFANPKSVHIAREAIRGMIEGGRVHMKASANGTELQGSLVVRGIGAQVLKAYKTQNPSRNRFYESYR